jgi:hypothetical protein
MWCDAGVDAGAVIPATILSLMLDRFVLGGRVFDAFARVLIPRYRERVARHEAGHFLVAYLLGCPIQACILRPVSASHPCGDGWGPRF